MSESASDGYENQDQKKAKNYNEALSQEWKTLMKKETYYDNRLKTEILFKKLNNIDQEE